METNVIIVKGKLLYRGLTIFEPVTGYKGKGEKKIRFSLSDYVVLVGHDLIKELADTKNAFTPHWLYNPDANINMSTNFEFDITNASETDLTNGSIVKLAIKVKEGRLYPLAVELIEKGEPKTKINIFDVFDTDELPFI